MVESLYPARSETLYCGLTLHKHEKTLTYIASNEPEIKAIENEPTTPGAL